MRNYILLLFACLALVATSVSAASYDVAAYVWPAYHPAPRWAELGIFKAGKGEWQSVWEAVPKWEGHDQPRKPLWGYTNEADPKDVAQKIDAAVSHGVNVFIYDWYWYGGRPFLEDALNKGFLGAPNNGKMKFFIMWANHNVGPNWDNTRADKSGQIWSGEVSFDEFKTLVARWIDLYFRRPNYYRIQDRPVVMLYDLPNFIHGLGGVEKAREAIAYLKRTCQAVGLNGAHVMACDFGLDGQPVKYMGFDSATIYNFVHWSSPAEQPDYDAWTRRAEGRYPLALERLKLPAYFPHASVGWDQNPRYPKTRTTSTVTNSTPAKFEAALRRAKDWADRNVPAGYPKLITVNSWNEWTEGSYLEPDERNGFGYLEAVKHVFCAPPARFVAPQISCSVCSQADLDHAVETLNMCYELKPVKGLVRPYFKPGACPSGKNDYGSNWWSLDYALAVEGAKWLDFSVAADLVTNLQAVIQSDGRMKLYGSDWSRMLDGRRVYASSLPKFHETVFAVAQMSADANLRQAAFSLLERNLAWWYANRQDPETKLISAYFEETFVPNTESGPGVYAPLDTNFALVIGSQNAARLAELLGRPDRAAFYRKKADEISAAVARYCRDPKDGLFRPYLLKEKRLASTDPATMFLAFRLPPSEHDDRLMAALKGERFGWNGIPLCTVSRADPTFFVHDGDYRGNKSWSGSVWTLTNDAVIRALRAGGEDAVAAELALKTVTAFRGNCAEFLNPDTGRGNGMRRYAWTASQFIRILFEDLFGLSYTPEKGLVCHPAPGFSGTLRNLRLPDGSVRDVTVPGPLGRTDK